MIAATALILVAVIYRIVLNTAGSEGAGWVANFAPLAAIAFCGAVYLPKRFAFAVPLLALLISDLVINAVHGISIVSGYMLVRYTALALVAGIGLLVRKKTNLAAIGAGVVSGTLSFYLITNTASWLAEPGYAGTLAGWVQALTVGLPPYSSYAPTWMFLRNSLISDLLYTALFVGCMALSRSRAHDVSHQKSRRYASARS
jgi:hypothetical protein